MQAEQSPIPVAEAKSSFGFSPPLKKFALDCVAGTVGGIAVVFVGHPFGKPTFFQMKIPFI